MSREKRMIEELADFLWRNTLIHTEDLCHDVAETIIIADYRKQSEGEWVDQYQGLYVNQLYKCSLCGETAFHDDKRWFLTHHCPNCGAKMKGV